MRCHLGVQRRHGIKVTHKPPHCEPTCSVLRWNCAPLLTQGVNMYDYGLIGDMSSAALVGMDGSVDWLCLPRFDSPSVFAAILDQDIGGRFRIRPSATYATEQAYLPDTNILETTFATSTGVVSITDFMPIQDNDRDGKPDRYPANPPELHRIVRCLAGTVEMRCDYEPRHDYARAVPTFRAVESGTASGRRSRHREADRA